MNKSIVVLLLAGVGLALFVGGTTGWLLGGLTLIAAILFVTLRGYFPARQAGTAVGNLVAPSVGTGFAQQAQTTTDGEVLLPYQTYKKIHRRLTVSLWTMFVLMVVTLVGLRTLPVPTTVLLLPALGIYLALAVYSALSLVVLVPSGQRLATVRTLFLADPRLVFAQYATHRPNGEVTVGYTTYKRLTKATGYVLATLLIAVLIVLTSEVQQARVASEANVAAANQQFQVLAKDLLAGQGNLKTQVGALLAQSLQPAPTIDEKSLTQRVLSAVSKNLPPPPVPIVRETLTEQTKIVNQNFIAPNSTQPVTIGAGSSLAYKDDRGTTFLTIGSGPTVTIPDGGTLNIQGGWQIDGTNVTASATELNTTGNLNNADQGNEGARYVSSRAADFTNFSPSRDDVQAALAAIDTAIGTTNTNVSNVSGTVAPLGGAYVTIGNTSSLTGERALTAGTGLTLTDGGANGSATLAIDGTVATLTGSQTLTNKTLASPIIATISNTGTLTLPTTTDTLVGRATTDTLTNKTISGATNTITNVSLTTGVTGTLPIANGGTNNSSAYTSGSVLYSNGSKIAQDNSNLFWDGTNHRLGIGTTTPTSLVQIAAGTATVAPLGLTSGPLLTTTVAGKIEFLTDDYYATITNGAGTSFTSDYPPAQSSTYVKATSVANSTTQPYFATDPTKSVTGDWGNAVWGSTTTTNQRFHIDLGLPKTITRIYYENAHSSGGLTSQGVQNFTFWGSNNATAFADTTYADDTNWTQITPASSVFLQHVNSDVADPHFITVTNSTAYRYYAFKFADNYGGPTYMAVRRIELQEGGSARKALIMADGANLVSGRIPYATTNGRLIDNTNLVFDGTNVGIGTSAPSFTLDVTGTTRVSGQTTSTDGFVNKIVAGACVDGSFTTATNGLICLDSTDGRLYFRYGGAWHYAAQTAGFQIPNIVNEQTGTNETAGIAPGDLVIGQINQRMDDGALHGLWVKFDLETELSKLFTAKPGLLASLLQPNAGLTTTELKNVLASGDVTVGGDLTVKGTFTVSKQQAGFAVIPKGGTEVKVTFEKLFAATPVISPAIQNIFALFSTFDVSTSGFTIRLNKPAKEDIHFSWTAVAVDDPGTSKGTVGLPTPEPSPTDTPTPTPDTTPGATPEPTFSPNPTVDVSPTPTTTSEPSATPIPSPTDSPDPSTQP